MKLIPALLLLILLINCNCYNLVSSSKVARFNRKSSKSAAFFTKKYHNTMITSFGEPQFVTALKERLSTLGLQAQTSKLFNFLLGAFLKIIALLEGSPLLEIMKCVVGSVEVWYNSYKFPTKTLAEIKTEMGATPADQAVAAHAQEAETNDHDEAIPGVKESEIIAREVDCTQTSELTKTSEGLDLLDAASEEEETTTARFAQKKFNPKKWMRNIKNASRKFGEKISHVFDAIKEKIKKLDPILRKWLDKPIVKAFIYLIECSAAHIATLVQKGIGSITTLISGFQVLNIIKQSPKFIKMIIDAVKSIRVGFMKKTVQEKYLEYGKGTASLVMVIILSVLGS